MTVGCTIITGYHNRHAMITDGERNIEVTGESLLSRDGIGFEYVIFGFLESIDFEPPEY